MTNLANQVNLLKSFLEQQGCPLYYFLITRDASPWLLVEAKEASETLESHHRLHARKLGGVPIVQLVLKPGVLRSHEDSAYVMSASRFL